jgi:hypothetical protein
MEFTEEIVRRMWRERIRNTCIRGEVKMKAIYSQIGISRLQWYGQVIGMYKHRQNTKKNCK